VRSIVGRVVDEIVGVKHEIPPVTTVDAAIRHEVALEPHAVFSWGRDEVRDASAVDAHDGGAR
jgi:hypothetical protein